MQPCSLPIRSVVLAAVLLLGYAPLSTLAAHKIATVQYQIPKEDGSRSKQRPAMKLETLPEKLELLEVEEGESEDFDFPDEWVEAWSKSKGVTWLTFESKDYHRPFDMGGGTLVHTVQQVQENGEPVGPVMELDTDEDVKMPFEEANFRKGTTRAAAIRLSKKRE